MEQQTTSTARVALKWGVITGITMIIFQLVLNVTDSFMNTWLSSMQYVILIIGIVMGMRDFRSQNNDFMSYSQGLGIGSLVGAIAGFLASVFSYIYTEFIDTTLRQRMMDMVRQKMEEQGTPDEQIDTAIEMMNKFSSPAITFAGGVIWFAIVGLIVSLIISAILKKDKPVF